MSKHRHDPNGPYPYPTGLVAWDRGSLIRKEARGWSVISRPSTLPAGHMLPACTGITCYCGECVTPLVRIPR